MARMSYLEDENGCHIWQKATNNRGYGVVWHEGKTHLAHRVAWLLEHGDWPSRDLVIDHICMVKPCVNPAHLRQLPNHLNLRRAIPRGDAATEHRRAIWRRANARRRGTYRYAEGGE